MGCNGLATQNLHTVAFFVGAPCRILPYMERKYHNYIKEWRRKASLSQKELVARLIEANGGLLPDDPELRIPTTEASLSRIENGKQNFNMATLQVLADILGADEPGWLLSRNPLKAGEVVDLLNRLDEKEQEQARAVLEAMFGLDGKITPRAI